MKQNKETIGLSGFLPCNRDGTIMLLSFVWRYRPVRREEKRVTVKPLDKECPWTRPSGGKQRGEAEEDSITLLGNKGYQEGERGPAHDNYLWC